MARLKRGSNVLETARQRLAALKSFTPKPNSGPALDQYDQEVNAYSASLDEYNNTLSRLDALHNDLNARGANLRDKNKRMLAAVGALYGTDSNEYEIVVGTRSSERKRTTKKPAPTT